MTDEGWMVLTTVAVVLADALWYSVKVVLRRRGKPVGWFTDHLRDFRTLREAIDEEATESGRRRLRALLTALRLSVAFVVICFGAILVRFLLRA